MNNPRIVRTKAELLGDVMTAIKDNPDMEQLLKELGDRVTTLEDALLTSTNMMRHICGEFSTDPNAVVYLPNGADNDGPHRTVAAQLDINYEVRGQVNPWR